MSTKPIKLQFNMHRVAGFTGNQLKMIAFILMLCDDIGFMLIENGVLYGQNPMYWNMALQTPEGQRWYLFARILRFLGRMAFAIFAFLIVEGFLHTRSVRNYVLRLLFFGALSEVPFDLCIKSRIWYPEYQNVFFTLAIGVLCIALLDRHKKWPLIVKLIVTGIFCGAAYFVRSDYGPVGVLLISVLYIFREDENVRLILGAVISAAESYSYACVGALPYILIKFYNGRRGDFPLKYFFYFGYPAHLLLFYALVYYANR